MYEKWRTVIDDRSPIYRQIILQFCRAFVRGDIEHGERIPSIRELSALIKVNANTIQRAYQEMERDELINSKRGTGYFFTEDLYVKKKTRNELALDSQKRFAQEMRAIGCEDEEIIKDLEIFLKGGKNRGSKK